MPEVKGQKLDVSAEEQAFLRRCFRRFAMPYVVAGVALGAIAGAAPGWISTSPAAPQAASADDGRLREELASLKSELAALSQRAVSAESTLAKTRERLVALEQRGPSSGDGGSADTSALQGRVDATARRLESLEARVGSGGNAASAADTRRIDDQFATLGSRLARIEGEMRAARESAPAAGLSR
jgi:predicted  nucleic acid-binding Zn-ribbon protein